MELFEPLGLLDGPAAFAAIRDGLALPLQGGPIAFSLLRDAAGAWRPLEDAPEALTRAPAPFAGIARHRARPLVMGIVNCTPDSFSGDGLGADPGNASAVAHDGMAGAVSGHAAGDVTRAANGLGPAHAAAIAQGLRMLGEGADLLDVGGESTRPGAAPVSPEEEQARILPVIRELAKAGPVSVDTRHGRTMEAALAAGAEIVNDVSALRQDRDALEVVLRARCPVVLMHARTTDPRTMQADIRYEDAAVEVARFLEGRVASLERLGIPRSRIAVDPGLGFGKRVQDNLDLIARLPLLASLGCTILVGASRKKFIGRVTGVEAAPERVLGSVAVALAAAAAGAHILRVHDVAATVQALRMQEAIKAGWDG